jgi:oxygen-independent coproporphyrinogen-3 oxidase
MTARAGIYLHLPYCRSRCGYCAFVVTTDESSREAYFSALAREVDLLAPEAEGAIFDSVYLGGGTPSLSPPGQLASLLESLRAAFEIEPEAEVTLEANPDDVTAAGARAWKQTGITRVSVGVQSFDDRELTAVGRRHDAADAARALEALLMEGFSVSGDLILGLPGQTAASFRASAARLADAGVGHVSVYLLETEKSRSIEEDRLRRPSHYLSDDAQADLWLELSDMLRRRDFHHYEISNWALPGQEARHNVKYWTRAPTLGLGVSAHELWRERRRANVSAIPAYLAALQQGRRPIALDGEVSDEERARERIILGLRLSEGIAREEVEAWIARAEDPALGADWAAWREARLLEDSGPRVRLTERGFLLSNEIFCRFV